MYGFGSKKTQSPSQKAFCIAGSNSELPRPSESSNDLPHRALVHSHRAPATAALQGKQVHLQAAVCGRRRRGGVAKGELLAQSQGRLAPGAARTDGEQAPQGHGLRGKWPCPAGTFSAFSRHTSISAPENVGEPGRGFVALCTMRGRFKMGIWHQRHRNLGKLSDTHLAQRSFPGPRQS